MKVKIEYVKGTSEQDKNLVEKFIDYLKRKYPLKHNVSIEFVDKRDKKMTTGLHSDDHKIKVLVKNRLTRDVLRTLAHEWEHEHQMNSKKKEDQKSIEAKANAVSGQSLRNFEKKHKELTKSIYDPFLKKIEEIQNQLGESLVSNKNIISEIKSISVEKLPYSYDAVTSFVDAETMKTHYTKHYKGYVEKLNKELEKIKGDDVELEDIIKRISKYNKKVKNNGGGAFNHALFWRMLSPKKQTISGTILKKIESSFGSYEKFKEKFEESAKNNFGSGWVWLVLTKSGSLKIMTTSNQDNPLMDTEKNGGFPLLGLDLWEHAYYLKYKNERDKYVSNFWKVVNWEFVNECLEGQTKKKTN